MKKVGPDRKPWAVNVGSIHRIKKRDGEKARPDPEARAYLPQQRQPLPAISIFQVNGLPAISARGEMKQAPRDFNAQRSCQRRTLVGGMLHCKT